MRIWDPATGTQLAALEGHTGWVRRGVRVHPGRPAPAGQRRRRRTVRIWDPATGTSSPPSKATPARSTPCAPSPRTASPGWPAVTATTSPAAARCGSGTPPPAPSSPPSKATPARSTPLCAYTQDGQPRLASGAPTTGRCGSGTPPPAPSSPPSKATPARSTRCAPTPRTASPGWPAVTATTSPRRHGADLGPRHRHPARRPRRPHRLGQRAVRLHPGRPAPAGQRRRRQSRSACGSGTPPPAPSSPPWKATPARSTPCARTPRTASPGWPAVTADDSGGGTVRIWDPATGAQLAALEGHTG